LQQAWQLQWQRRQQRLALASRTLNAVSPLAVLDRGYALVTLVESDRLVQDASAVPVGSLIEARLASGKLRAQVISSETLSDQDRD
jgi:exodeoxyribonuclease VII large subunit